MATALPERIAQEFLAAGDASGAGVVSRERRRSALASLTLQGLPSGRDENWKYANLRPLERVRFAPAAARARPDLSAADLPPGIAGYARYVFADGLFVPGLSTPVTGPDVSVVSLRGAGTAAADGTSGTRGAPAAAGPGVPDARFALLNEVFATDGARLRVAAGGAAPACVEFVFLATAAAAASASYPRLELYVEPGAHLALIERHVSLQDDANFVNAAVHVDIGRGAHLEHHRLQQAGARSMWLDTLSATLAADARYALYTVALGALAARSTMHVRLAGEGAELALHAVALADGHQVQDALALVEHAAPRTRSGQTVRGIAAGRARVAFNSKVIVEAGARGTDSRQSLKGLLAGPEAEIDVRPQLQIHTDDVRCNHGATAGKLDEDMLYYMLSRGLERETAQRLLKWAFLEDVVAKIRVPELRRYIEQSLAGQLRETVALQDLL